MSATVAIAPFDNLSGDPAQDYFARGFVEDVATELSRFGTLEVLHPRAFGATPADPLSTRPLPALHVVHGSVRRTGSSVRVNVQLVEAANGRQLWADRYDATAADLLAVQDAIAARIASTLAVRISEARLDLARRTPLASLEAYDCWLRGLERLRTGSVEADAEARSFFEQALQIDPGYARAYAGISLTYFNEWSCQAWVKWDEKERLAHEYAQRARALDESDALVQIVLGRILVYRRQWDEAAHHVERALLLNPNDTEVLVHAAMCQAYLGDVEAALETATKALRLNPAHPPWYEAPTCLALFMLGRDRECLELAPPTFMFVDVPAFLAASCAFTGDMESAHRYLRKFLDAFQERIGFGRAAEPGEPLRWLLHVNPFKRPEDGERLAQGLALAGLEADPDEGRAEAVPHVLAAGASPATFRRDGQLWTMAFGGVSVQLTHQKGFLDLAQLLARPGVEMHCLELADRPAEPTGHAPMLDDRARRELQARVRDLQREIDDADAACDLGRAEVARQELDQIVEHLSDAVGLGGRSRHLGSAAERARSAVTWRIRSAIRKVAATHTRLGRHLENAVRTGTFCVYEPESPTTWTL